MKGFIALGYILMMVAGILGWVVNIGKFASLDFDAPYKAEVLRGVGIVVAPMGAVEGFIRISDQ